MEDKVLVRVRIEQKLWRRLRSLAILKGCTAEQLAADAIRQYLSVVEKK